MMIRMIFGMKMILIIVMMEMIMMMIWEMMEKVFSNLYWIAGHFSLQAALTFVKFTLHCKNRTIIMGEQRYHAKIQEVETRKPPGWSHPQAKPWVTALAWPGLDFTVEILILCKSESTSIGSL